MKASKFTDAQKAFIIKQGEEGTPVADIRRHLGNLGNDLTQTMRALLNDLAYIGNRVKALNASTESITSGRDNPQAADHP